VDDDLDFDFFEEETGQSAVTSRREGVFGGRVLAAGGLPPERVAGWRLAVGIAVGIIVLIVIVLVLNGGSSSQAALDRSYLSRLSPIAVDSQQVGSLLGRLFSGLRRGLVPDPLPRLDQLTLRALSDLANAEQLKPPVGLRPEHEQVLVALDFRARGLKGLHDAIGQAGGVAITAADMTPVAAEIDRLVTSDVVWHDLVLEPTLAVLQKLGIKGAIAPQSQFITDPNVSSQQSIAQLLQPQASTHSTLRAGSSGPAVVAWQTQLNRWLRLTAGTPITADGSFGPGTQAATQTLQRAQGLTPDGVVGPATRHALQTALAATKTTSKKSG